MTRARVTRTALTALVVTAFAVASTARAEATTIYSFDGLSTTVTATTPNTVASDWFGAEICSLAWGVPSHGCGVFGDGTMGFTVTPDPGYTLSVTGLSFDERNAGSLGPASFSVFTSADGFAAPILTSALTPSAIAFTHFSPALTLSGLTGPFEVRFVASGTTTTAQSVWYVDNVMLTATAVPVSTAVPEPSTLVLLGAGLAGLAVRRRRRS